MTARSGRGIGYALLDGGNASLSRLAFGFDAFRTEKEDQIPSRGSGTHPRPPQCRGGTVIVHVPPHAYTQTTFSNLTIFFLKKFKICVSNIMTD